jgi:hypothetical protein
MENQENDLSKLETLQNLLIEVAGTGLRERTDEYQTLRKWLMENPAFQHLVPGMVKDNRDLDQFWVYIKGRNISPFERKESIWKDFSPLFNALEVSGKPGSGIDQKIAESLSRLDSGLVRSIWEKALGRCENEPAGAITLALALVESVCKLILEDGNQPQGEHLQILDLYNKTIKKLDLGPTDPNKLLYIDLQQDIYLLRKIRNNKGDAHGKGKDYTPPAPMQAELAVNLAGAVAVFLVEAWENWKIAQAGSAAGS